MGALDDLIAQDEANMRRGAGGMTELDQLLANDQARNLPSNDPEIPVEEAPSFIGYDPATKEPETDPWEGLRSFASDLMDPNAAANQQMIQGGRQWRADQGGYAGITDNLAEAYVGSVLPGAGKGAGLARRALVEGAESMGMTAADKAGEYMRGEDGDLRADAREVLESGGFGAAGGVAGGLVGKLAGKVKGWAGEAAGKAKNLVTGMGARDAKATAAMHGVDAIDENYGGLLEKYSPSGMTGKSPKAHHKAVLAEKEAVGNDLRGLAKEINQGLVPDVPGAGSLMPGTPGDLGQAREKLLTELQRESGGAVGLGADKKQYRGALQEMIDELMGASPQVQTRARELHRPEPSFPDHAAQADFEQRKLLGVEPSVEQLSASPTDYSVTPAGGGSFRASPAIERGVQPDPTFTDDAARAAFKERQLLGLEPPTDAYWHDVQSSGGRSPLKPVKDFPGLIAQKSDLQQFAHSGPGNSVPENAQKQAAALGGSVLKDEVSRIVGQQAPPVRDRYVAQNQNFAELATLEEMLRNKAAAEGSGGDLGGILASSALSGIAGAGAGALAADDPMLGAIGGGVAGFAGGLGLQGGATRTAIRQGGGARMTDAGANMLRGLERGAGRFEDIGSSAGAASIFAERRADKREQPGAQIAVGQTRLAQLLKTNPAALGDFASLLSDVANDPRALEQRAKNLAAREPMFRRLLNELDESSDTESRAASGGITFSLEGE